MTDITATIRRLRELEAKATKGPWDAADCISPKIALYAIPGDDSSDLLMLGGTYADGNGKGRANCKLIVALRNAAPDLLAYVERLEKAARKILPFVNQGDSMQSQELYDHLVEILNEANHE